MSWIKKITYEKSDGDLRKLYDRVKGPENYLDNILTIHGLRPHTLQGHLVLYKNVLHHNQNTVPKWFLETVGVYVSILNHCDYCVQHHFAGLKKALDNNAQAEVMLAALKEDAPWKAFNDRYLQALHYARKLCLEPSKMQEEDITSLRNAGFPDGEILELNQVVAYFNYANRTVLGLGVNLAGDVLGTIPQVNRTTEML